MTIRLMAAFTCSPLTIPLRDRDRAGHRLLRLGRSILPIQIGANESLKFHQSRRTVRLCTLALELVLQQCLLGVDQAQEIDRPGGIYTVSSSRTRSGDPAGRRIYGFGSEG
jgi:hypothetical protein